MARAFASQCQLKECHETHSASRDWDPSDSSCTLHRASLVFPTIPVLDWAEGHPHPPLSTGPLPHAVLLRGAGRFWHESCWHRRSGICGALQVARAGREHVPSQPRLCLCLWKFPALDAGAGSPHAGRGGPWGGAATPGCLWWHWHHYPQTAGMVQRGSCAGTAWARPGRAALGGRWEPCPPWHMLIACNGESSISSNP